MIPYKNIVFDMGRVLANFDPTLSSRHFTDDPDIIREIDLVVYHSSEWIWLDLGLMTEEEAMKKWEKRCSSEEVARIARLSFEHWDQYNLYINQDMESVVRELKARGHMVYVLSNISARMDDGTVYEYLPAPDAYDGVFLSAVHKCLKPQRLIYEKFCAEFDVKPQECFFIDDLESNIDAAAEFGMDGYVFDGDVEKLRKVLEL